MEVNCRFIDVNGRYQCVIDDTVINEKDHVIKEFKGVHQKGKSHKDIKYVCIHATTVNYFPRGLQEHFPNLNQLMIFNCSIKEISKNDLKGLDALETITMNECQLTTVPDDLFSEMPNLREVSFKHNEIEFASSEFLRPLRRRENVKVDLRENKNIDAAFWPGSFNNVSKVKSLDALMKLIDDKCFNFNKKIKKMWLSERFSDLKIIAGDKEFKVHKAVLGMQSEVFAEIFEDQIEANEMKISDFSSESVGALLKFIYTNEISRDGNAKENFQIADKFKVDAMKSKYEEIIYDQVEDSNYLLKQKAIQLIAEKIPELSEEFMEDPEKLMKFLNLH